MVGPAQPRLTHVAFAVADLDVTIAWYAEFTDLEVVHERRDDDGSVAWLGEPDRTEHPFVLVAAALDAMPDPGPTIAGFAHFGIELPSRADVDAVAERGRAAGCLRWEVQDLGPPVGYVCALADPDGNLIEFSHDQGVYDAVVGP
ncbi:MAG: VOC family protein [Acidimicrobiia bacterium]|nr:VOC family protein [Acidimicrobiia bacterium]MDH5236484.1 VOC family protein [Acidimicrobiia bacterium]